MAEGEGKTVTRKKIGRGTKAVCSAIYWISGAQLVNLTVDPGAASTSPPNLAFSGVSDSERCLARKGHGYPLI